MYFTGTVYRTQSSHSCHPSFRLIPRYCTITNPTVYIHAFDLLLRWGWRAAVGSPAVNALLDAGVDALCHLLQGQLLLHVLHHAGDGRLDALHASLDRWGKEVDVSLP